MKDELIEQIAREIEREFYACVDEGPPKGDGMIRVARAAHAVISAKIEELTADRDEWKAQHENLLGVRQSDLRAAAATCFRWQELCRRALAYLSPTLGITKEIRAALPPYDEARSIDATIDAALAPHPEGTDHG